MTFTYTLSTEELVALDMRVAHINATLKKTEAITNVNLLTETMAGYLRGLVGRQEQLEWKVNRGKKI